MSLHRTLIPTAAALLTTAASCVFAAQPESDPVMIVATSPGESARVAEGIPLDQRTRALDKAWQQLNRMVHREADGSARALHRVDGTETWVEWRDMRIDRLDDVGVDQRDVAQGILRRYRCTVRYGSHRIWQPGRSAWSAWRAGAHRAFPQAIDMVFDGSQWQSRVVCQGDFVAPGCESDRTARRRRVTDSSESRRIAMR